MNPPVLKVENLRMNFRSSSGMAAKYIQAVRGVTFTINQGEIVGLVGETGSGKTTVGKCIARLNTPTSGRISFLEKDITTLTRSAMRPVRRDLQMVFQDPYSSLDPRMTIAQIVAEPLGAHGRGTPRDRAALADLAITRVGLAQSVLHRYPNELSGGQRQRVGLARALILEPQLLIADEPVSALDVSVRAGILNRLVDLQSTMGFSCLFITHDLSVAEFLCDRIAVLYLGEIVETGSRAEIFGDAQHPYTRSLLAAAPLPDPVLQRSRERTTLRGEPPSALDPPSGCSLHPRCPFADERCTKEAPGATTVSPTGHTVRCHRISEYLNQETSSS